MRTRCPECEEDILLPEPPTGPEIQCTTCGVDWAPGADDPHPGWRVPVGGPAMWAKVMQKYDSDRTHDAFVSFCAQAGALNYAARRYRRALDRSAGTDERAAKRLERLEELAVSTMSTGRTPQKNPVMLNVMIAVLLTLVALAFIAIVVGRSGQFEP